MTDEFHLLVHEFHSQVRRKRVGQVPGAVVTMDVPATYERIKEPLARIIEILPSLPHGQELVMVITTLRDLIEHQGLRDG